VGEPAGVSREYSEDWRPVHDIGDGAVLNVSNRGRVRSAVSGKLMRPSCTREGFRVIRVRLDGRRVGVTLHRLVAKAFLEGTPTYPVIFRDGDRSNCDVLNLRWALPGEQETLKRPVAGVRRSRRKEIDKGITRLRRPTENGARSRTHRPNAKLTPTIASEIRVRAGKELQKDLAREFGVSRPTVSAIVSGRYWSEEGSRES